MVVQPLEIFVDDETKLTLHGLQQHYVKLEEVGKNRKLNELLDTLEFNQVRDAMDWDDATSTDIHIGCHFREVGCACYRARQAACFVQLPQYRYPLWSRTGGAVCTAFMTAGDVAQRLV